MSTLAGHESRSISVLFVSGGAGAGTEFRGTVPFRPLPNPAYHWEIKNKQSRRFDVSFSEKKISCTADKQMYPIPSEKI